MPTTILFLEPELRLRAEREHDDLSRQRMVDAIDELMEFVSLSRFEKSSEINTRAGYEISYEEL